MWFKSSAVPAVANSSISSSRSADRFRNWVVIWLLAGLAPALIFIAATEALLRFGVAPNDNRLKHVQLFHTATARDAAFGDSQMMMTITGIPGMVNLAMGGENFRVTEYRVKSYFADRKPGRVIVMANPNIFSEYRERAAVSQWTPQYISTLADPTSRWLLSTHPVYRLEIWNYWQVWLEKGGFENRVEFRPDGAQFRDTTIPADFTPREFEQKVRTRVKQQVPLPDMESLSVYRSFIRTLDFLKERGAEVCLVTTPFPKRYREIASGYESIANARKLFDRLAREYGFSRVDFWNAVDDDRLFADTDHLNLRGAQRVARRIVAACFAGGMTGPVSTQQKPADV